MWDGSAMTGDEEKPMGPSGSQAHPGTKRERPLPNASPRDILLLMGSSLEAVRDRIDDAYNHICQDLPEVNREILHTFRHASDTLDSLTENARASSSPVQAVPSPDSPGAGGRAGSIPGVAGEMKRALQNLLDGMIEASACDSRLLEELKEAGQCTAPGQASLTEAVTSGVPPRFAPLQDELRLLLSGALDKEVRLAREITAAMGQGVGSFQATLGRTVEILKDLISRSNAVKMPVLAIMSGLQTHDIVNQDIATLCQCLERLHHLQDPGRGGPEPPCPLSFRKKASLLCRALLSQLIEVIRRHGDGLEQEIASIEKILFDVKEDKDALSEFLLANPDGTSTFDRAAAEVSGVFFRISASVDALCRVKERQAALCAELAGLINAPALSPSPAARLFGSSGPDGLRERSRALGRDAGAITETLGEIRELLIESVKGIDTCSGRCLDAIAVFRQDIRMLMHAVDGTGMLLDGLESFTLSLQNDREEMSAALPRDLSELLFRLENPHSSSLASPRNQGLEEGLIFF